MYKLIFSTIFIFLFVAFGQVCAFDKELYVERYPDNPAGIVLKNEDGLFMLASNIKLITNKNFLINPKEKKVYIFDVKFSVPGRGVVSLDYVNFPIKKVNGNYYVDLESLSNLLGFKILDNYDYYLLKRDVELRPLLRNEGYNGMVRLGFSVAKNFSDLKGFDLNPNINTVCFTWFSLEDGFGNFTNNSDIGIVDYLHKRGYKVWGLFSNKFDPKLTHTLLDSKINVKNAINQIVAYAFVYHLDGINIDFEDFDKSDSAKFDYFVEKLAESLRGSNILLSVDITVPDKNSSWSMCYDRKTLSEFSDYIVLMSYDEFSKGSYYAGPTASIGWVKKGLEQTLKEVEANKVLLGIPFYTREWIEDNRGKVINVRALYYKDLKAFLETNKLNPQFDEKYGLYHVSFYRYNLKHEVWFDNSETLYSKLELIEKHNLGGFAIWNLEAGNRSYWNAFSSALGGKLINIGGVKDGE